jgi:hypothetical protein
VGDPRNQLRTLEALGMINATLQNATPVAVSAHHDTEFAHGIIDELGAFGTEAGETLLNNVVPIKILDKIDNTGSQGADDDIDLLGSVDEFDHLLESPSTVLVERNGGQRGGCSVDQDSALIVVAMLEELLAEVVAKRIRHELNDVRAGLDKDALNVFLIAIFQLALEVTTAVLVLAKLIETATVSFQGNIVEASFITLTASTGARALD